MAARFALKPDVAKNVVLMVSPHIDAPAFTTGDHITLDDSFARQNLKQVVGALIHELTHVIQAGENAPGWFIEGMADYTRSIYGPADDDWSMPPLQPGDSYNDAYRVAARFLHWLDQHTVPTIVDQLSHAAQTGGSFSDTFQRLTGGTVDDEWSKYVGNSALAPIQRIPAPDN
ncbi:MAG TPA: basic secretory protein-like protein [Ktedonobacteraceae bacterium]|nr:basic secretory protein-like protein [Ktedonobacteraceae bacterium]